MSEFKFQCPQCLGSISADPEWEGQVSACPHCGDEIRVPQSSPATKALPPPSPQPPPPRRWSLPAWLRPRKAFAITILLVLVAFAGVLSYSRTELKRVQKKAALLNAPVVYSDDPFVLSNGYRMSSLYEKGADGRIYEFRDRESLEAWKRQQPRPAEKEASICSLCSGTGRNTGAFSSSCGPCSGGGTRLTPSGHRIVCNNCEGTGIARQDPNCIYCQGTGRVGLPGQ